MSGPLPSLLLPSLPQPLPLSSALAADASRFGGKAAALARASRAGLPVPPGWAVPWALLDALAAGEAAARRAVEDAITGAPGLLAVRSSAVGEDGATSSFAGQHLTRLGVAPGDVPGALVEVWRSAQAPAAMAYRARRGIEGAPRVGAIVQALVAAEVSAVVFTLDPVRGDDVVVIEASLGLGESVVGGAVIPDRFVADRRGRVLACEPGDKDTGLFVRGGRVEPVTIDDARRAAPCLSAAQLARVFELIRAVDAVWSGPHDLEIAWTLDDLHLLQRRPLTARPGVPVTRDRSDRGS